MRCRLCGDTDDLTSLVSVANNYGMEALEENEQYAVESRLCLDCICFQPSAEGGPMPAEH